MSKEAMNNESNNTDQVRVLIERVLGSHIAPAIDLGQFREVVEMALEVPIKDRSQRQQLEKLLALIDASPKYALPALPDDFSESKDWRAGNYADRIQWLMVMVRSQREHIDALAQEDRNGR